MYKRTLNFGQTETNTRDEPFATMNKAAVSTLEKKRAALLTAKPCTAISSRRLLIKVFGSICNARIIKVTYNP